MLRPAPRTLVEGLRTLPPGEERGFRFRGLDGNDSYYPFEALRREATRRAAGLLGLGFLKGDRLALVIAEPQEFVLTFLGAVLAGVVPVPIYPRASFKARNAYVQTVAHIVEAAGARGVCTMAATREVVDEVLAGGTRVEKLVILEEFLQHEPSPIELPTVEPDDLCFLQFTSGSTSMPKGVMVTHENLVANAACFLGERGLDRRQDDVAITWLPLYHDMGLIGFVLGTILFDIPTVLLPTEAFARRPSMWMEAMSRYGGTITFAPNFAYGLAAKRARDKDLAELDLSRVRIAGCGAEPINADVMRRFTERFAPVGFKPEALLPCYGMAEATLAITFCAHDEAVKTDCVDAEAMRGGRAEPVGEGDALELVCCGRGFPDHTLRVVDERGEPVAERAVGEIVCRGPSVTPGYYENPEATAEGYRDGWLHTGDLGYMVADELYVCGRIKDLIIIRGANFYPQDIEWAVAAVEGVRRDNVIAFSVMQGGEEQLVVAAEGNSSDAPRLRTAIATKVAETTGLQAGHVAVVRVGTLPKTSSGKVQRRRAKALFEQGELEEHRE